MAEENRPQKCNGKIGSVICWENYMPALRMAMYNKGIELYCAPTADDRDSWISTMQHVAVEGRCFVLSCNQYTTRGDFPEDYACIQGDGCTLITDVGCSGGDACYMVSDGVGLVFECIPPGAGGEGATCSAVNHCQGGMTCTANGCRPYCTGDGECTSPDTCLGIGDLPAPNELVGVCGTQ